MDIETIRRICLARHLYQLGESSLASPNDMHLFAAVNLLQDAVEAFLIAVGDHVNADIDQNTKFDKYFTQINDKISPRELPFKSKLIRLNRIRIDSKHYGIQPARDECERVLLSVREFFDEVSSAILDVHFSTLSAIDLLEEGEIKNLLLEAKRALESGNNEDCVIACRKVIYIEVEQHYDVAKFQDGMPQGLLASYSKAPYYARNPQYIQNYIKEPTDFIVLDHSRVDQDLMKDGVDTTAFWNVWRLTPDIYQTKEKKWVVKHEFGKLDPNTLSDNAEYVFATVVDLALAIYASRKAVRFGEGSRHLIGLAHEGVPIFEKADSSSKIVTNTPAGMISIESDYRINGLKELKPYWHVSHMTGGQWLRGFIQADDVAE